MNDVYKPTAQHPGRFLLFLGMSVAVAGTALMFLMTFALKILVAPWYAPIPGTVGVALIILALRRSRSMWRWTALVFFTLFTAFLWWALFAMRTPAYTGPVKDGQPFPAFATTLADGSSFTQDNLKGDQNTIMIFFRGHW